MKDHLHNSLSIYFLNQFEGHCFRTCALVVCLCVSIEENLRELDLQILIFNDIKGKLL